MTREYAKALIDELNADASKSIEIRIQDEIIRERERCAKIADETADCAGDRESMLTAQVIAEEIRKGD